MLCLPACCIGVPCPQASNVLFDLGLVGGGNTFMKICSTSLDVQDLRLAYRCAAHAVPCLLCLPCCAVFAVLGRMSALSKMAPHLLGQ